jgi:AraC-like DNA-binding protein
MNEHNILNIIALIAIFVSILLTFFLLTVKSKNRLANILLAGFILVCAVDISGIFIVHLLTDKPELYSIIKSVIWLIFPLFYHYVLSICYKNFKLKPSAILHLLPFALYNLLVIFVLLFAKSEPLSYFLHKLHWIFNAYLLKLQAVSYLAAIIYVLRRYKRIYLENYTNGNLEIYKWLSLIVLVFLITLPLTVVKDFLIFKNITTPFTWTITALTIVALCMFCWFILKALYNPEFFRGVESNLKPTRTIQNRKSENIALETELDLKNTCLIEHLGKHMKEKEPFLEPTLTLQDLALQMNIHARELSILINRHIGQHFFDFINKYRIEKAIEIIEKSSTNEFTIQQILFDVGFNSKSSFNTAFKKHTGLTPTQYRNKHT